jgi:hypothetical protein
MLVARGCFLITTSVATTHIYRENPPRVTVSHNRLGISLSKCIRHGLITKINDKKRPRTCEALDQILVDYSRARRALVTIASPRRGERVCTFFSISSLLHKFVSA